jgi:hypothetical protein
MLRKIDSRIRETSVTALSQRKGLSFEPCCGHC